MIKENTAIAKEALADDYNAQYWDERCTIRDVHTPKFLRSRAYQILTAGKYLHVLKGETSSATRRATIQELDDLLSVAGDSNSNSVFGVESRAVMYRAIESAHKFSSRALLRLLEDVYGLSSHLRSLRRYFLLENGDFFVQFMDTAEEELRRDTKDVAISRIRSLLQQAVVTSTLSSDPHKEELTCNLAQHNLIQQIFLIQSAGEHGTGDSVAASLGSQGLKGVEALTLDYKVGWPVSIVLSKKAITKYQLLSRLLFFSKHVELRVHASWRDHQDTKGLSVRSSLSGSYALRHRMLHFLQNFVYYMTLEVIGPRAHEMQLGLAQATDMDEVLTLHEKFMDLCLRESLLASQDLLKILTKLMTTCLLFSDHMKRYCISTENVIAEKLTKEQIAKQKQVQAETIISETSHESYKKILAKFTTAFEK